MATNTGRSVNKPPRKPIKPSGKSQEPHYRKTPQQSLYALLGSF